MPHIVAIGGGHGLSAMLRGLKRYTKFITAIVTVADDGGGSGMLREDLGMLPPGRHQKLHHVSCKYGADDARSCSITDLPREALPGRALETSFLLR